MGASGSMIDPRFYSNAGPFSLGELADRLGGTLDVGAPRDSKITDLALLHDARETEIALFAIDRRYREAFYATRAAVVVTRPGLVLDRPPNCPFLILVADPRQALAELLPGPSIPRPARRWACPSSWAKRRSARAAGSPRRPASAKAPRSGIAPRSAPML